MIQRFAWLCAVACHQIQASITDATRADEANATACLLQNQFSNDRHMSRDEETERMPLVDRESAALQELRVLNQAVQVHEATH